MFQTFKIYLVLLFLVVITACSFVFDSSRKDGILKTPQVNIGVLLPLSGNNAEAGKSILNSIHLAYSNINKDYLTLKIYDTQGTALGAKTAVQRAISDRVKIIIGPLLGLEVMAIKSLTEDKGIPVITLSNDIGVLRGTENIYTVAYLPTIDIEKGIDFAIAKGSESFAVLAPDNRYGRLVLKTAEKSLEARGLQLEAFVLYPPSEVRLTSFIREIIPPEERQRLATIREKLANKEEVLDEEDNIITRTPDATLPFDTLIIGDFGKRLMIVATHLPVIDIDPRSLTILGNSNWDMRDIRSEPALQGAFFPKYNDIKSTSLAKLYAKLNLKEPTFLDFAGYDSMLLASSMVYKDDEGNLVTDITKNHIIQYNSKDGALGEFTIRADGTNQRAINMLEVVNGRAIVVDSSKDSRGFMKVEDYQEVLE